MDPNARRDRLRRQLADEKLDALLVSSPVNVTYLTGFSGEASLLVLTRTHAVLVSDSRFTEQIAEECPGLEAYIRPATQKLPEAVAAVLGQLGVRSVGFESSVLTVADFEQLRHRAPTLDWKPGSDRVERLRMIKDADELAEVRAAIAIAERAFTAFCALLRPDDREKDLCDAMEHYVRRCGGQSTCFPPIIAAGPRAALPHAPPTDNPVGSAGLLLVDWGATGPRQYKSDLTRVLDTRRTAHFPAGAARLEDVHAVVLRAQEQAIAAIRPGVQAQTVDAAARAVIAEAGFGDYFGHGTGHGLGLQVHEGPAIRPLSETMLEPGMIFTVEPGIYLPGWGGVRLEDDVLVTPQGCEVLSHLPRDLAALRAFS
jgi:Xaa-Pro aminopeptidase